MSGAISAPTWACCRPRALPTSCRSVARQSTSRRSGSGRSVVASGKRVGLLAPGEGVELVDRGHAVNVDRVHVVDIVLHLRGDRGKLGDHRQEEPQVVQLGQQALGVVGRRRHGLGAGGAQPCAPRVGEQPQKARAGARSAPRSRAHHARVARRRRDARPRRGPERNPMRDRHLHAAAAPPPGRARASSRRGETRRCRRRGPSRARGLRAADPPRGPCVGARRATPVEHLLHRASRHHGRGDTSPTSWSRRRGRARGLRPPRPAPGRWARAPARPPPARRR